MNEGIREYVLQEMKKAEQALKAAQNLLADKLYDDAVSRKNARLDREETTMTAEKRSPPFPGFGIMPKAASEGHRCEGDLPKVAYGEAIRYCFEGEDSKLWITNEEYASQVNYCPYCGYKATVEVEEGKSQ